MLRPLTVRLATRDDAAAMTDLLNAIILTGGTTAMEKPLTETEFSEAFIDGRHVLCSHVAIDLETEDIAGFQVLERDATTDRVDIATFARLHPKIAGVGTSLFAVTQRRAAELGVTSIVAQIRSDNHGGLAYYEKMGFRTYDMLPSVPLLDGRLVDRVLKRFVVR